MSEKQKTQSGPQRSHMFTGERWWPILIAGIISLVLGVVIVALPRAGTGVLLAIFGVSVILLGIISILRSITLIKKTKIWWILLLDGTVSIIIVITAFVLPVQNTDIAYFFGIWLAIIGILSIILGALQKSVFPIISGIMSLIVGLLVLFSSPYYVITILIYMFGVQSILRGAILIIQSINMKKAAQIIVIKSN